MVHLPEVVKGAAARSPSERQLKPRDINCAWNRGMQEGILSSMRDVTTLLPDIEQGDVQAADQLLPVVYNELRRLTGKPTRKKIKGDTD